MKIELKKLKRFPSIEWGENGGVKADIYIDGVKAGYYFDAGEGGDFNWYPENSRYTEVEMNNLADQFLKSKIQSKEFYNQYEDLFKIKNFKFDLQDLFLYIEGIMHLKKLWKKQLKSDSIRACVCKVYAKFKSEAFYKLDILGIATGRGVMKEYMTDLVKPYKNEILGIVYYTCEADFDRALTLGGNE